ncbi:hypothetical protein CF326_g8879 [Tilletia indica]|nr:hypothetical protein CF326_g8879 [Tilletia indica]
MSLASVVHFHQLTFLGLIVELIPTGHDHTTRLSSTTLFAHYTSRYHPVDDHVKELKHALSTLTHSLRRLPHSFSPFSPRRRQFLVPPLTLSKRAGTRTSTCYGLLSDFDLVPSSYAYSAPARTPVTCRPHHSLLGR